MGALWANSGAIVCIVLRYVSCCELTTLGDFWMDENASAFCKSENNSSSLIRFTTATDKGTQLQFTCMRSTIHT